jgi:hypothetical protein
MASRSTEHRQTKESTMSQTTPQTTVILPIDWAYISVDPETGFAMVLDMWEGLAMAYLDTLDEALDYCEG